MGHDDAATPQRPPAPVPARDGAPPPAPPTPVRESLGGDHGDIPHEEGPRTAVELVVDGASWTVSVGGMSRSGAAQASAPILLILFEGTADSEPTLREAWVVGRTLADLTELHLEAAFRRSRPAPAAWARKPLFPEAGSRSGRDAS